MKKNHVFINIDYIHVFARSNVHGDVPVDFPDKRYMNIAYSNMRYSDMPPTISDICISLVV